MKLFLFIFVAVAATCCAQNDLTNDIYDFANLLPIDDINEILDKYIEDEELVAIITFVAYSEEFKQIVLGLEKIPETLEVLKYMEESGLEVYEYLNLLHEAIGLPPLELPETSSYKIDAVKARNIINQINDDVRAILDWNAIAKLHDLKMAQSPAFQYFSQRLESPELEVLLKNLTNNSKFQDYMQSLLDNGLDLVENIQFSLEILGFRQPSFSNLLKSS